MSPDFTASTRSLAEVLLATFPGLSFVPSPESQSVTIDLGPITLVVSPTPAPESTEAAAPAEAPQELTEWSGNPELEPQPAAEITCPHCKGVGTYEDGEVCDTCQGEGVIEDDPYERRISSSEAHWEARRGR
jgi:hypothetical protein